MHRYFKIRNILLLKGLIDYRYSIYFSICGWHLFQLLFVNIWQYLTYLENRFLLIFRFMNISDIYKICAYYLEFYL